MFDVPLLIGGQAVPAASGARFEHRNPLWERVVSRAAAQMPFGGVKASGMGALAAVPACTSPPSCAG